jgi:hypothetical protein
MTDNKIIKEFELFIKYSAPDKALDDALELIKRQQATIKSDKAKKEICAEVIARQDKKIERLQKDSERLKKVQMQLDDAMKMYSTIKTEAIKQFAERLKEYTYDGGPHPTVWDEFAYAVDNLVAEMVGD